MFLRVFCFVCRVDGCCCSVACVKEQKKSDFFLCFALFSCLSVDPRALLALSRDAGFLDTVEHEEYTIDVLLELGVENIQEIIKKFETDFADMSKLEESRVYCYLTYYQYFMSVVYMEKKGVDLNDQDVNDPATWLFRIALKATKDNCQGFFSSTKMVALQHKMKGYFRLSDINVERVIFHVMVQGELADMLEFYQELWVQLCDRDAEMCVFNVVRGKLFSRFETLPAVDASNERRASITSLFDESAFVLEPNIIGLVDFEFETVIPSAASSLDRRVHPLSGFVHFRPSTALSTQKVRFALEPSLESMYATMHAALKAESGIGMNGKNEENKKEKNKEEKNENENKKEFKPVPNGTYLNKYDFNAFEKFRKKKRKEETGKSEAVKPLDYDDDTEEKKLEKENNSKNKPNNKLGLYNSIRVMFYSAENVDSKPQVTKYTVSTREFERKAAFDLSKASSFKDGSEFTYQLGLQLSEHCLNVFHKCFRNDDFDSLMDNTVSTLDLGKIYQAAQMIEAKSVMKAIVKEIVRRFLSIKDVNQLDDF